MSWIGDLLDRIIHRIKVARDQHNVEVWIIKYGKTKAEMFLEAPVDKELEKINGYVERMFNRVNKKTKGKLYEIMDWHVERDSKGKIHIHVYEL